MAADRCTSHHENNTTSHNFDSRKIIVFNNRLVALHCGDYFVNQQTSTHEFLESCADLIVPKTDIISLPLAILSRYNIAGYKSDNTFLICGFDNNNKGHIYEIVTTKNSVYEVWGGKKFGGKWQGITDIAYPILKNAKCDCISILDAAILCKTAIEATGKSQLHCGIEISVGDKADVYVMHKSGNTEWFSGDPGFLVPTPKAE